MSGRFFKRRSTTLVSALLAVAAVLLATGLTILLRNGGAPEDPVVAEPLPDPEPEPEREPEPEPEPEPQPVEGELEVVELADLSTAGTGLFQEGQAENEPVAIDEGALEEFTDKARMWLDEMLTHLQSEGDAGPFADGLSGPEKILLVGDPDNWIVDARYLATIGVRGAPEWAEIVVSVTREDGSKRAVTLAVLPGESPVLIAAGEGPDELPANDEDDDS